MAARGVVQQLLYVGVGVANRGPRQLRVRMPKLRCSGRSCRVSPSRRRPSIRPQSHQQRASGSLRCAATGAGGTARYRRVGIGTSALRAARRTRSLLPRSPTHSSGLSARRCPRRIRTYRSIAVAVCAPKGTMRPLPPLPRRTVATPRGRSTSDTFKPTTSPARIPVSAINRTMASSRRSRSPLPAHALIHAFSSVSVSASVTLVSSLGGLTPSRGSVSNSPSSVSHAAKRLSASWRERAVDGSALTGSAVLVYISLE